MSNTNTTDERDLGEAGAQLSTAPREEPTFSSSVPAPAMGVVGWTRWFWRQLTSMRVALILLFLLSLGAIPGSLIPQNSVDELKVQTFKEAHTTVTPIYEKLQLFDVYSSVWFSAIYILLFVSLIGCIVPRTGQFVGQLRDGRPAPRRSWTGCPRTPPGAPTPNPSRSVRPRSPSCASGVSARTRWTTRWPPRRAICARPGT